MVTVLAFDVNETLLDLSPLDGILGGAETRKRWFSQMLQIAFVGGLTGDYVDFPMAQRAALRMLGLDGAERLAEAMRQLPPCTRTSCPRWIDSAVTPLSR